MLTASFVIPAIVALGALLLTGWSCPAVLREGARPLVAMVLSLAAMLPQASLCLEYGVRLLTHSSLQPPEVLSTFRLATLWLLVGPVFFVLSFRRSRWGSSPALNIVRTAHVVGWAVSAPTTLFTLFNV